MTNTPQHDILFKTPDHIFSLRVSGVLIRDSRILLQRVPPDPGYAYPGGHVAFMETTEEALIREFREELGTRIAVIRLLWIGELFFPWGDRRCHQISYTYLIELREPLATGMDSFMRNDNLENREIPVEFSWVNIADLDSIIIYPTTTQAWLRNLSDHIQTFTSVE